MKSLRPYKDKSPLFDLFELIIFFSSKYIKANMPYQYGGEIDYSSSELIRGSYRLQKLTPRNGGGDVTITTAGGQESSFDLISRPFNLSRSVLSFTYTCPASGGGEYNKTYMDCLAPIRQIQLQTRSGVYLCDMNDVNVITKIIWKPETSMKDFLALENHDNGTGAGCILQKCNAGPATFGTRADRKDALTDAAAAGVAVAGAFNTANIENVVAGAAADIKTQLRDYFQQPSINARRHDDTAQDDTAVEAVDAKNGEFSLVNVSYNEAKYFTAGLDDDDSPSINVKLNLGMLYDTIFALDKTIMFPEILTLRIVWAPTTRIYFYSTQAQTPGGAYIDVPVDPTFANTIADGNVTVSNLNVFLATETNPNVIQELQAKIASAEGFTFNIDYPMMYRNTLTSQRQNVVLRFDAGHGKRLKRIYHALFNEIENINTAYDIDNRGGTKVTSFYTTLDGTRQQEFDVSTANLEDYMLLKPKLEASALMNSDVYQYNWFWCDFYDNNRPLWSKDQSELSGLDLSMERRWEFISNTANATHNHYTFAVIQRSPLALSFKNFIECHPQVSVESD